MCCTVYHCCVYVKSSIAFWEAVIYWVNKYRDSQQVAQEELEAHLEAQVAEVAPEDQPYQDDSQEQCDEPGEIDNPYDHEVTLDGYLNQPLTDEECTLLDDFYLQGTKFDFAEKAIQDYCDRKGLVRGFYYRAARIPRNVQRRAKRFMGLLAA